MNDIVKVETRQMVTVDWEQLALTISAMIADDLKKSMLAVSHLPADCYISMLAMCADDASKGLAVCKVVANGNWDEASTMLRRMDTAPRENIYAYLCEVGGDEFVKNFII
jgi:hypothetical protein